MEVTNQVLPTDKEQIEAMMQKGPDGPIFMVNLLKFKDKAVYEDGRETDLSGRDAYMIYGHEVSKLLPVFGGKAFFAGDVTHLSLGKVEALWDEVAIAIYPERSAMVKMSMSPEWQALSVHRTAGLEGQLNIETTLNEGAPDWLRKLASEIQQPD
jgi:uncharacterized protein (DUF1330 family)